MARNLHIKYSDEGDWIGVYSPEGNLLYEGHDIEYGHLLTLAEVPHTEEHGVILPTGRMPATAHPAWTQEPRHIGDPQVDY